LKGRERRDSTDHKKEKTMTMQTVSLSALERSTANPRRKIDRKTIEGLAVSIRTDGLLHKSCFQSGHGQEQAMRTTTLPPLLAPTMYSRLHHRKRQRG
jgi:hypothetical protein